MELIEAYKVIEKNLDETVKHLGFSKVKAEDETITYKGNYGIFRVSYDGASNIMSLERAVDDDGESEFKTVSKSLFELAEADDRDCRSFANEVADELNSMFKTKKKQSVSDVKMPKGVSRSKAKKGAISYDADSLANRFGVLYPEYKDEIKKNIIKHGEFLPEAFFIEFGTPKVLDVIKNGSEEEHKRLFKMLCEVYEDGTNEVQDIIGVTILGAMHNAPDLMAVADRYMSEYMAGPVHEINKMLSKKNSLTKRLANPPAYKPKKKKTSMMDKMLDQAAAQQ